MRIKLFEEYLTENVDFFNKIDSVEWGDKYWRISSLDDEESFTNKELNQIRQHFKSWVIENNRRPFMRSLYHKGQSNMAFRIMKTGDEWYYVSDMCNGVESDNRYYKCDQIEGLIRCLDHCISFQIEKEKKRKKAVKKIKKRFPRASSNTIRKILSLLSSKGLKNR